MGLFDRIPEQVPPAIAEEFRILLGRSMEDLRIKTGSHDSLWHLGEASWALNQPEGTIVFTAPGGIVATCAVQIIGTYNTEDSTWLWGWDHPSIKPPLQEHAYKVRAYGEQRGIEALTARQLRCAEADVWELAALACYLGNAQGAYRAPFGPTLAFVTFNDVKLNKPVPMPASSNQPPPIPSSISPPVPQNPPAVPVASAPIQPGSPEATVSAFIAAHFAWNEELCEKANSAPTDDARAEIVDAGVEKYDALVARFCTAAVKPQGACYGTPMHDPQREAISSSSITGPVAVIRTQQVGAYNITSDYEYHLVQQNGQWRISSLLSVVEGEKYESL